MKVYPKLILKYDFEITEVGGETVAVCIADGTDAYHGIIRLNNRPAAFMFGKLKEGITLPELIMACMTEFTGSSVDETGPKVIGFLEELKAQELITSDPRFGVRIPESPDEI